MAATVLRLGLPILLHMDARPRSAAPINLKAVVSGGLKTHIPNSAFQLAVS